MRLTPGFVAIHSTMRTLFHTSFLSSIFSTTLLCSTWVYAQQGAPWLIVPTKAAGSAPWLKASVKEIRNELLRRRVATWSESEARTRFETLASTTAPRLESKEIETWKADVKKGVHALARGELRQAQSILEGTTQWVAKNGYALNREAKLARRALDACLFLVRVHIERGKTSRAETQALECLRLVPQTQPNPRQHTPETQTLLKRVQAKHTPHSNPTLEVKSKPKSCAVRVHGVNIGKTPLTTSKLVPGRYGVQLQCPGERATRVHQVELRIGRSKLSIDPLFDRAIQTQTTLHLQYADPGAESLFRISHARELLYSVPAGALVLLSSPTSDALRIDLRKPDRPPQSAWIKIKQAKPAPQDIREAFEALLNQRSVDLRGPTEKSAQAWKNNERVFDSRHRIASQSGDKGQLKTRKWGWALTGIGLTALATAGGLHGLRNSKGDDFKKNPDDNSKQQSWFNLRAPFGVVAGLGGALTTTGNVLLLEPRERTPWWIWTAGALGLAATGYIAYELTTLASCNSSNVSLDAVDCVNRERDADRTILVASMALPLLSLPLTQLIKRKRRALFTSASATREHIVWQIEGRF